MANTDSAAPAIKTSGRIQSIEVCRLVASIAVVFIHCRMPGNLGEIANGLARFAVPFFFIVSGYFSFHATTEQIRKRILGIVKINIVSTLLYLLWKGYKARYIFCQNLFLWFKETLSIRNIASWIFLNTNPFSEHLWYLNAAFICYCLLYLYVIWKCNSKISFNPLYQAAFALLAIHLIFGTFATAAQYEFPNFIYRNALFFGFPMFAIGLFLREYQDKIFAVFHPTKTALYIIILAGCILTLLERFGFGKLDLHIGNIITVIALMLLLLSNPQITRGHTALSKAITKCGSLSTWIYITHVFWKDLFLSFSLEYYIFQRFGEEFGTYLLPFIVIFLTLFTGIIWEMLRSAIRRFKKHILP